MDDAPRDTGVPASRPRGRLSSRPAEDRATPVADASTDYAALISASASAKLQARATMRIDAGDLDRLVDETRRTGSVRRPAELPPRVSSEKESASSEAPRVATEEPRTSPEEPRAPSPEPRPLAVTPRQSSEAPRAPASWRRTLPLLGGVAVLAGCAILFPFVRARLATASLAPPDAVTQAAPSPSELPSSAPAALAPGALPAIAPGAGPTPAEGHARAALERLRTGLGECIRHGIHGLPGSSPPVPSSLASLRGGPYRTSAADWRTAVWSCAHFQVQEDMGFQLQWQLLKPGVDGLALAWIDADHDGVADRALGFHITLGARGEPVLGDIAPIEPTHPTVVFR